MLMTSNGRYTGLEISDGWPTRGIVFWSNSEMERNTRPLYEVKLKLGTEKTIYGKTWDVD